ncbi:MAG TPA: serine protease, partial [Janthinobacterium sp.]|nr:serine protease [Janthinobacterium sp.]
MNFNALAFGFSLALLVASPAPAADQLVRVIDTVKPSIVGIGSYQKTRSPALIFIGTGFVVGDGLTVVTAAHVAQKMLDGE